VSALVQVSAVPLDRPHARTPIRSQAYATADAETLAAGKQIEQSWPRSTRSPSQRRARGRHATLPSWPQPRQRPRARPRQRRTRCCRRCRYSADLSPSHHAHAVVSSAGCSTIFTKRTISRDQNFSLPQLALAPNESSAAASCRVKPLKPSKCTAMDRQGGEG